jgi:putative colanic acid biosynthesis UDP-glucose lipid carrier transferase
MQHRFSKYLPLLTFVGDIFALNGLLIFLYLNGHLIVETYDRSWFLFLFILNVSWVVIVLFTSPYRVQRVYPLIKLVQNTGYSVLQHFLFSFTLIFLFDFVLVHNWGPIISYLIFGFLILVLRMSLYYFLSFYRSKGYNFRNVAIIGFGAIAKHLEVFFTLHPEYGYRFIGYFDDVAKSPKVIGDINGIKTMITNPTVPIDEIYCCLPYVRYGQIKQIIDLAEDRLIKVKLITDFRAFSFKGLELERYDHIPVLNVSSIPLDNRDNQVIKRIFDVLFSLFIALTVFSWLFPIIALAIKLDSKGPVFFKQKRTGKDNTDFLCWKFRTMRTNGEADIRQATRLDCRVTRVGAILRKTSLDELPQFFNVLQGTMSVVGPRPHMLKHTEEYARLIKKFMVRHHVKPGITGLAQAKGYRGETKNLLEMKNRVKLDRFYIENWSFILDLKIIVATAISLAKGDQKAY